MGISTSYIPTLLSRLTPTLCAWTEPAIVTHGTPMYKDSHVVVVPAYGNVSKLQRNETKFRLLCRGSYLRMQFQNICVETEDSHNVMYPEAYIYAFTDSSMPKK
jgi:hypothetical protein